MSTPGKPLQKEVKKPKPKPGKKKAVATKEKPKEIQSKTVDQNVNTLLDLIALSEPNQGAGKVPVLEPTITVLKKCTQAEPQRCVSPSRESRSIRSGSSRRQEIIDELQRTRHERELLNRERELLERENLLLEKF